MASSAFPILSIYKIITVRLLETMYVSECNYLRISLFIKNWNNPIKIIPSSSV